MKFLTKSLSIRSQGGIYRNAIVETISSLLPAATKLGQGNVLQVSVCPQQGFCLSACWDTTTPKPGTPLDQTPPDQTPPDQAHPPEADASIRSMSGRYASYWNAFLFWNISTLVRIRVT